MRDRHINAIRHVTVTESTNTTTLAIYYLYQYGFRETHNEIGDPYGRAIQFGKKLLLFSFSKSSIRDKFIANSLFYVPDSIRSHAFYCKVAMSCVDRDKRISRGNVPRTIKRIQREYTSCDKLYFQNAIRIVLTWVSSTRQPGTLYTDPNYSTQVIENNFYCPAPIRTAVKKFRRLPAVWTRKLCKRSISKNAAIFLVTT